jgi:hypothetical protein
MRQLNSDELLDKFNSYSKDVEYCSFENIDNKIIQLFNFLYQQDISKRILERINEDFILLYDKIFRNEMIKNHRYYKEMKNHLSDRELQGAFGFYTIKGKFESEKKHSNKFVDLAYEWYDAGGNDELQNELNTHFWIPFAELFEWYLYESDAKNDNDYFSIKSQENLLEKLNKIEIMIGKLGPGQEVVFNEISDLKKLTKRLNQKNWKEIIKGKFGDLVVDKIITIEVAQNAFHLLTGNKFKLLG